MNSSKNIVVTGASRGVGLAVTTQLLNQGHSVFAVSRNVDALNQLASMHANLQVVQLDITSDLSQLVNRIKGSRVDVLLNNAGYLVNKPIAEQTDEDILHQYQVNAIAPMRLVRELLPYMKEGASICNISSMGGVQGSAKFPGLSAYSSSKGALSILTECLAEELSEKGVSCNALALGAVQTEMLSEAFPDYKAPFTPNQMASFIVDFILKAGKFYNGKVLPVSVSTP